MTTQFPDPRVQAAGGKSRSQEVPETTVPTRATGVHGAHSIQAGGTGHETGFCYVVSSPDPFSPIPLQSAPLSARNVSMEVLTARQIAEDLRVLASFWPEIGCLLGLTPLEIAQQAQG